MAATHRFSPGETVTVTLRTTAGPKVARGRVSAFNDEYVLLTTDFGSRRIRLTDIKAVSR